MTKRKPAKSTDELLSEIKSKVPPEEGDTAGNPTPDKQRWSELIEELHADQPDEDHCRQLLIALDRPTELLALFQVAITEHAELMEVAKAGDGLAVKLEPMKAELKALHAFNPPSIDQVKAKSDRLLALEKEIHQTEHLASQAAYAVRWAAAIECFVPELFNLDPDTHPFAGGLPVETNNLCVKLGIDPWRGDWRNYRKPSTTPNRRRLRFKVG